MKNYVIQKGDTFSSLARQFKVKDEGILKTYHNLYCPPEDIMQEPVPGKKILIPEDPQLMAEETEPHNTSSSSGEESTENTGTGEENPTGNQPVPCW